MNKLIKLTLSLLTISLLVFSCTKDEKYFDSVEQFELEKPIIKSYVQSNYPNMVYASDSTGMWYEILDNGIENTYTYKVVDTVNNYGQSTKALRLPTLTVRYTGKLISNGSTFDSNQSENGVTFNLSGLIYAWKLALIPNSVGAYSFGGLTKKGLQKGAKIRFVTPSALAYGNNYTGSIPPNSPLYFEIEILDIK